MEIKGHNIKLAMGKKEILQGVDITLHDGEILGIIGPNGSGKSTFLKCVYRTLRPDSGYILLNGKKLDEFSYRETAMQMAVVSQHNMYNFDFKVIDVVLMGRSPYKKVFSRDTEEDYTIAQASLERVGLGDRSQQSFSTLSGGEQQRVMLARALTQDTPCLILDEPTNHLDIRYQLEIMEIVRNLNATTLMAVHDLNIAAKYCHCLLAIDKGQVVGCGEPASLLTTEFIESLYGVKASIYFLGTASYPHVVFEGIH
ncbi:ABC transporter ATP-binding protein [Veillonella sp.]|uniref:ABC transporter ATP-binding protein n=1 Tax=Veillonella sp. TaxID=1926307 RepID=UPI0025F31D81|nr:ABC transporter ATP-binding protein [Veillonella sp.]